MELILKKLNEIEQNLLEKKSLFTIEELSRYTGFSPSFLYKKTASRQIPFFKPFGKIILFDRKQILEFLLRNPICTTEDIEQQAINYLSAKQIKGGRDGKY